MAFGLGLGLSMGRGGAGNGIPFISDAVQWLQGGVADGTLNEVKDKLTLVDPAKYVGNACIDHAGLYYSSVDMAGATTDFFGACTITRRVFIRTAAKTEVLFSLGNDAYRLFKAASDSTIRLNTGASTGFICSDDTWYTFTVIFNSSGQAVELLVDGVSVWTGTAPSAAVAPAYKLFLGARDNGSGAGLFSDAIGNGFSITRAGSNSATLPTAFDYTFAHDLDINYDDDFRMWISGLSVADYKIDSSNYYYMSTTGDDSNDGKSLGQEKATMDGVRAQIVIDGVLNARVLVMPGTYLNKWDNASLDTVPIEVIAQGPVVMQSTTNYPSSGQSGYLYVEGIKFTGGALGGFNLRSSATPATDKAYFNLCSFDEATRNGFDADFGGEIYMERCSATLNTWDGFNYHEETVTNVSPKIFENLCVGLSNGQDSSQSSNASTAHENSYIVHVGCVHTNSKGRNIHHISNVKAVLYSVTANTSRGDDNPQDSFNVGCGFETQGMAARMWLYDCDISGGANVDLHIGNESIVYVDRPIASKEVYAGGSFNIGITPRDFELDITEAEGSGLTLYDRGEFGFDMTLSNALARSTDDEASAENIANGFYTADGNAPFIPPTLLDITVAANGLAITNPPDVTHNGAESLILETDLVNGDLLARAIFSNDGIVFDARSMQNFKDFTSGIDNVWIKWHPTECRILEIAVYDIAFIPTLDQYNALVRYFVQGSCGGGVVPFPDMLNFTYDENQQNIPIIL